MRFAILGANADVPPLVEAIQAERHQSALLVDCGPWQPALSRLAPDAAVIDDWETLLDSHVDAVVVAASPDEGTLEADARSDQLRKLTAAGVPLLVVVPCCEGIVGYELDMIRRDTNSVLFPYSPLVWHAGADRVESLVVDGDPALGEILQLIVQREAPPLDDAQRLRRFAQDAHLLDRLLGGLVEFSASSSSPGTLENFSAHLRGGRLVARWSLLPGASDKVELTVVGQLQRVRWTSDSSRSTWIGPDGEQDLEDDAPRRAVRRFVELCESAEASPWEGACRAAEATDNALRSAARGRSVLMQEQTPTEEDTFKGMMAAGSCGLLMLTLIIVLVGGLIESVRFPALRNKLIADRQAQTPADSPPPASAPDPRPLWLRLWPLYPFAAFLLLQLLRLVFLEETGKRKEETGEPRSGGDEPEETGRRGDEEPDQSAEEDV